MGWQDDRRELLDHAKKERDRIAQHGNGLGMALLLIGAVGILVGLFYVGSLFQELSQLSFRDRASGLDQAIVAAMFAGGVPLLVGALLIMGAGHGINVLVQSRMLADLQVDLTARGHALVADATAENGMMEYVRLKQSGSAQGSA